MSTFEIIMAIINVAAIITVPIAAVFIGQSYKTATKTQRQDGDISMSNDPPGDRLGTSRYRKCAKHD